MMDIIKSWQKLQDIGDLVYNEFPDLNCSCGPRKDAKAFKDFCNSKGIVLDVGCGLHIPIYLQDKRIKLGIGIDPLVKEHGNESTYLLKSVGEYIPFRNEFFDFVCFATSFDHVIDHKKTLEETKRVLKKNGYAIFWIESGIKIKPSLFERAKNKTMRTINPNINKKIIEMTEKQQKIIDSVPIPEGAIDKFHLRHIHYEEMIQMCESLGFKKEDEKFIDTSVFIKFRSVSN